MKKPHLRFLILPLLLTVSVPAQDVPVDRKNRSVGYSVEFTATIQVGSEEPRILYKEVRWISASGNWKSIQEHVDGKKVEKVAELGQGVFRVDEKEKKLVRLGSEPQPNSAPLGVPAGSRLISSERLLDLDTDVFETTTPTGSILLYRARQLNGDVVKVVRRSTRDVFTLEATKIVLGEPDPQMLRHAAYPVVESQRQ